MVSTFVSAPDRTIRRTWRHYGWFNVGIAAVAMTATFPGRIYGIGCFTDSIRVDLDMTRTFYGSLNLWARVIGAFFCLPIGGPAVAFALAIARWWTPLPRRNW